MQNQGKSIDILRGNGGYVKEICPVFLHLKPLRREGATEGAGLEEMPMAILDIY